MMVGCTKKKECEAAKLKLIEMSTSHSMHYTNYVNDPTPENNEQLTMINGQINQTNLRIKRSCK